MKRIQRVPLILILSLLLGGCAGQASAPSGVESVAAGPVGDRAAPEAPLAVAKDPVAAGSEIAPVAVVDEAAASTAAAAYPVSGSLSGVVRDENGPLAEAIVRLRGGALASTSASDGTFTLSDITLTGPISVTAWLEGYYVRGVTATADLEALSIEMARYDKVDHLEYEFASVSSCAKCHRSLDEWDADAHSHSALNPRFLSVYMGTDIQGRRADASYDAAGRLIPPDSDGPDLAYYGPGYKLDYPTRSGNCAACHTPTAAALETSNSCGWSGCHTEWTASMAKEVPQGVSPSGILGVAEEGINCDFCHKIGGVKVDPVSQLPGSARPGIMSYELYRPDEDHDLFFGPFDDVPDPDTYLPLIEEGVWCAPCHYGLFGGVAESHDVVGGVEVYNSYGEWLASPYSDPETGQTCQDCHMPPVDYEFIVPEADGGVARPYGEIHNHTMPGASDVNLLQNSVSLAASASRVGDQIAVEVRISNDQTGHHVPTGSPYRHLILLVTVSDSAGQTLPLQEGRQLPDWTGDYAGRPGTYFAKLLQDEWSGESPTAAYWRNISLVEDTRLAAKATYDGRYLFSAGGEGPFRVEVQLIYRRAYQQLMDLKDWNSPDILMEEASIQLSGQ